MKTMYPNKFRPLGADICTGGPSSRAWTFGMYMTDEFDSMRIREGARYDLHATQGCGIVDGPLDAPCTLPAGSTKMDWFPRTSMCKRENLPLHVHHDQGDY